MKTLKIYDPAMCCSTGVCGPDVDTELVQLANFLKNLDACSVKVERYNLSQEPAAYTAGVVAETLKEKGTDALPLVLIDDEVISTGEYPDLGKLSGLLGTSEISMEMPDCSGCCGCD
ncbi:arsenite efflux transporter metallochaperone ArsD [Pontiella agarivorans]|uniref:Arsenite efflux transporter metallochaperone ArsD n=1 Tax=Pontiella agarivorans TaxID=3038953 RepID=A0ABU5MVT3_9BACT|nr:arsenite efflux transporter metallochaperone ArsD [Pontiella agarivorans]MDZ8118228.1 arsenite efflux transporter metallochaperone ArsD [Pontiella agarivorans]